MTWLLVLVLTLATSFAAEDPPQTFEDLCVYDQLCKTLKNTDGSFVLPKPSLLKVMSELKTEVRVLSHKLGVDPRAVAGAIVAENSMNVQVDDDTHAFLEKIKLNPLANMASKILRGKSFSLGLGQIKPDSAYQAEAMLAKLEKRPKYSLDRVTQELLSPIGSLKYATAIVRFCQDEYAKQGFDVSKDPGVLASLYNLGNCEARAQKAKLNQSTPKVNYFGYFVNTHMKVVEKSVDYSTPYSDNEEKELEKMIAGEDSDAKTKFIKSFNKKTPLYAFPPNCSVWGGGNGDAYSKDRSYVAPVAIAEGKGDFQIISNGIDCDLEDWALVRTTEGKTGWISNKDLDETSSERVAGERIFGFISSSTNTKCDPQAVEGCKGQANQATGGKVLGDANGFTEVKLIGNKEKPEDVDVKDFDPYCLRDRGQYGYGRNSTPNVPISAQVAAGLVEQVERKKKEIIATFELKNWEDPQNVFKDKMSNLESLKSCDKKNCVGQLKLIQEFLKDDLSQYNGYHGYTNFMAKYGYGINVGTSEQNSKSDKELWLEFFASVEKACTPLFKASPLSRTAWEDLRDRVELNDPEKKVQAFAISETRVQESCDLITKAIDKVPIPATEAGYCSGCQIQATFKSGSSSYGTQMSKSVVQAMLKTPQDYADFFNGALEGIQYNMGPQNNYTGKKCKYDPLQSAKRIEAILKLDCVDAVFVPDMYLVNSMRQYKGRVFYRPFDSDDRFAYSIKNSCPGGRK